MYNLFKLLYIYTYIIAQIHYNYCSSNSKENNKENDQKNKNEKKREEIDDVNEEFNFNKSCLVEAFKNKFEPTNCNEDITDEEIQSLLTKGEYIYGHEGIEEKIENILNKYMKPAEGCGYFALIISAQVDKDGKIMKVNNKIRCIKTGVPKPIAYNKNEIYFDICCAKNYKGKNLSFCSSNMHRPSENQFKEGIPGSK